MTVIPAINGGTVAASVVGMAIGVPGLGLAYAAGQHVAAIGDPFGPARAEVESLPAAYADPENAMTAVDTLDAAANLLERTASAFARIGAGIAAWAWLIRDPVERETALAVAAAFEDLAGYVRAAADATREGATHVRAVHAPELERIEDNDPTRRKWDLAAHDDH